MNSVATYQGNNCHGLHLGTMNWNQWQHRVAFLAALAGFYWAFIFVLTHVPGSGRDSHLGLDKIAHFLAYLGLAVLLGGIAVSWRGFSIASLVCVWILVAIYGVFDEVSQKFVAGRTCSLYDWLADALGSLTGILLIAAARGLISRSARAAVPPPAGSERH